MAALGWLVAMIAAAGALALPFARGGQFVLALTPFSNAYGAAGATALVLLRWALFEMPGRSISRGALRKISVALGFLVGAIIISSFVSDDLLRLASESAQWIIGVGLFCAIVVGGREPHERPILMGMIAGGVALAFTHFALRALEISVDAFAVMPFMISEGNNYAALYALVALVILPAHPAARLSTPVYLALATIGIAVTVLHDSRAQMAIGGGIVVMVVLLRHLKPRVALATVAVGGLALILIAAQFLRESLFSNSSVVSLANFQTNYSNLERLGLLLHSLDFFSTHPVGAGLGASSDVFPSSPFTVGTYPSPHNTFALLIVEIGWWGLIAYVVGVLVLLRTGIRACLRGQPFGVAAIASVGLSIIDAMFFNGSVSLVFWLLLAFILRGEDVERHARVPMIFYRTA